MRLSVLLLLCFLVGVLLLRLLLFPPHQAIMPDAAKITFSGRLSSSPKVKGTTQSFILRPRGYEQIFVTTPASPRLFYGERVKITGTVKKRVLEDNRTVNSIYFPTIAVEKDQGIGYRLRQHVIRVFEKYLPLDPARLLLGIAFGIKEPLSTDFSDRIRLVGLLHVIAASGMNITLLAGGLVVTLGKLLSRRMTVCITLMAILFYASFAGFEPSIVRAGIMGGLALVAGLIGRQYFGLWALCLTGYGMLLFDPLLRSDVGFQLSFLATLGIMLFTPLFAFRVPKFLEPFQQDFTTSLGAQVTTAPTLLLSFGQVSLVSLLINALILWTIPPLMVLGGLAAIVSFLFEPLAAVLLYLCLPLLLLFRYLVLVFSRVPFAIHTETIQSLFLIGYYMLLLILIVLLRRRGLRKTDE